MITWSNPSSRWNWCARVEALLKRYRIVASQTVQVGQLLMNRKTFRSEPPTDRK